MQAVKSLSDAVRMAARQGASAEIDGRVINSAGARMSVVGKSSQPADIAPIPPPPDPLDRIAELLTMQARVAAAQGEAIASALVQIVDRLHEQPAHKAPAPQASFSRRPISIEVVRDDKGQAIRLVPAYGQTPRGPMTNLEAVCGADGRIERIQPTYQEQ